MKFTKSGCLIFIIAGSALILLGMFGLYLYHNEAKPTGKSGPQAEELTQKMMSAINNEAWQEVKFISWNFGGRQTHLWDKERHLAQVTWGENTVLVDPNEVTGVAYVNGQKVSDDSSSDKLVKQAWKHFINDSFWLNAPSLARQPGTTRSIVQGEDGLDQLMITYTSGGDTPGDSYLWKLDANGRPISYKMWVKIIPVGGVEFSWENWKSLDNGAMISTTHAGPGFTLELTDIKSGDTWQEMGYKTDPFAELERK